MREILILANAVLVLAACGTMRPESEARDVSDQMSQGEGMKVHFERSGGFAGMMTTADVDADSLPDAERETLLKLVADANFFTLPAKIENSSPQGADRFNYRITIESKGKKHTVETTDGGAPASLVPLLDWMNGAARRGRRPGS